MITNPFLPFKPPFEYDSKRHAIKDTRGKRVLILSGDLRKGPKADENFGNEVVRAANARAGKQDGSVVTVAVLAQPMTGKIISVTDNGEYILEIPVACAPF